MARTHTTLDLDRELLHDAAEALGTTRTTDTVHAALREVVARRRRAWLARRDFSELEARLPELRAPREVAASERATDEVVAS
jgi:Arc/MetJ family transcription regulator